MKYRCSYREKGSYLKNGKWILDNISIFQKLPKWTIWNERLPSNSNPFEESIKRMKSATLDNLLISQHLIEYNLVRTINYILHLNNKVNCEATPLAINFPHLTFTLGQTEGLSQKIKFNTQNKTNVGILLVRNYLIISSVKSRKVFARTCIIRKTIMG